jgi:type IV secretion system protein VirD4
LPLILGRTSPGRQRVGFTERQAREAGRLITYAGDGHLITVAPTGTGKTAGPCITNGLLHPGQLIVIDIKGEVHKVTAQARINMGQEVHVLDLRDDDAFPLFKDRAKASLNPLDLAARSGTDIAAIARSFAAELIDRPADERDRFWNDWAESLITGGVSWLMADRPVHERSLGALFDLFHSADVHYRIAHMMDDGTITHRAAKAAFESFLDLPDHETRPCVLGFVQTHLRLFDSDVVRSLTDSTSFDLDAFIAGKPMSLYVIVPPIRLNAYRPLLRMWLSGLIMALTERKHPPEHRTLMLCDEVGNLGRIDALLTAATLMRSWGLTLWTFWQNAAQLSIYGPQANTLVDNAGVVQVFGARNHRMAQDIANLIGGVSPEAILRMPPDEQILLIEGNPVRCKQVRYYSDRQLFDMAKS